MTEIRLGRAVLRDPSGTHREITSYERFLEKRFQEAKAQLDGVADSPANINERVDAAMGNVATGSESRVLQNVNFAQKAGYLRSEQFLVALNITSGVPLPPDQNLRLDAQATQILEQRNLAALKGITDETAKVIKEQLSAGILAGEGSTALAKRLDNSVGIGIERARVMAREETMKAFRYASDANYKRRGITEIERLEACGERTCDDCKDLNGKRFPINEQPDYHIQCRGISLPVISEVPA